jgi:DNA-binding CsgD family transcriptional regulator
MAIRAVQPLAYVLFEQACAMVDRVPDEAIADDRRLDAELAWARGMARSTRTDPRCAVEFSTAIQLGADGVHPRLVAITTTLLTLMDVAAFPNKALRLVEDPDLPSGALGDPGFCFVAMIAAGAGTGELTGAEPWTEKFDTYRERWPDGWLAVAGDLQAALIAWYRGDLHQIDQRCRRARDALAARGMPVADSAPGTNYAGVMVQAMECYAHAARGHAPIAGSLRLLGHARRQGQARPGDIMALAIGDGHRLAGDRKFAYDHLVDLAGEAARAGNLDTSAYASVLAGRAALAIGEFAEARRRVAAVSDLGEELRLGIGVGHTHVLRAELALVEHERGAANTIHTALEYVAGRGYRFLTVDLLDLVTAAAGDVADYREIARLAAAVNGVRNDLDYRARTPGIRDQVDTAIAAARDALGEDAFDRAFAEGRQLSLEDTVAYVTRGRGARARHATGWASLTPTEVDVVEAICRGLTNQQIGEGLLMSRDTVKTHLSHIYAKVGVANRAELAAQARRSAASS